MKKLIAIPLIAFLSLPGFAGGNWQAEEERMESETIEAEQYDDTFLTDEEVEENRLEKEQRMEERDQNSSSTIDSDSRIDYKDRTRTDRARDALNTGGDASDDQ